MCSDLNKKGLKGRLFALNKFENTLSEGKGKEKKKQKGGRMEEEKKKQRLHS